MITWLRAKTNPVPETYDCLLLLDNGDVCIGRPSPEITIIGWSALNRPEWITSCNYRGKLRGEDHPKTKLSDHDCHLIRELYATRTISYQSIADKFECSKSTIYGIVNYVTRC